MCSKGKCVLPSLSIVVFDVGRIVLMRRASWVITIPLDTYYTAMAIIIFFSFFHPLCSMSTAHNQPVSFFSIRDVHTSTKTPSRLLRSFKELSDIYFLRIEHE